MNLMRFNQRLLVAIYFACSFLLVSSNSLHAREWTDASGTHKIEAELVAIRGEKVVLEKPNGEIISIPIGRLSSQDQAFLLEHSKPQSSAPAVPSPEKAMPAAAKPSTDALPTSDHLKLAEQTEALLRKSCYRCHGEDGSSEGGFNFAINLEKLATTFAKPGSPSLLMDRITAQEDSVMPPAGEEPRLSSQDIATIQAWIDAGSPTTPKNESRPFITNEEIVKSIYGHVSKVGERNRRFMRYFTLTHLYNAGVSEDELQTYRNAFAKLINSLSWNTDLVVPEMIDHAKTVFAIDMRSLHWNKETWQAIEEANPYFVEISTPDGIACREMTETAMPYVRVDWFTFAASKPPLYHTALGLPDTDRGLEDLLRVNVQANIDQEQAIRAGFNRSGVSQNNRLIEWHKSPYGSYWKSYDFGGNIGRQNLFECPLGPSDNDQHFRHDGGEIIFTLPNGLLGFLLVDERGSRIDQGPTAIVSDPKQPDRAVVNGVSCMSCHYAGIIPKRDEVGLAVQRNRNAFAEAEDILALYRPAEDLDRLMSRDSENFAKALQKLQINNISRSGEPISAIASRFQMDIDLRFAASEFGLQSEDFLRRLSESNQVARMFSSLTIEGGTLKRDVFKDVFQVACVDLKLTLGGRLDDRDFMSARKEEASAPSPKPARTHSKRSQGKQVEEIGKIEIKSWGASALAIGKRGTLLAVGHPDRKISLYSLENQSVLSAMESLEGLQGIKQLAFTPDGSRLIAGGDSGQISIFSISPEGMLKPAGQFAGHSSEITCLFVSADGKFAMSGEQAKKACCWEIATGEEIAMIGDFAGEVRAVHAAKVGRTLYATDGEKLVEYDLGRKEVIRSRPLTGSWSSGQAAAISANGKTIAVGDGYHVRLWDIKTGKELPKLEGNEICWSLCFSPDGQTLYGGGNAKVNLWNVETSKRVSVQNTSGTGYIQTLAVSEDGKTFVGPGSSNRMLHIFAQP